MGTDKRERQKAGRQARIEAARIAQQKADQRAKLVRFGVLAAAAVVLIGGLAYLQSRKSDETVSSGDQASTTTAPAEGGPASVPAPPEGKTISGETPCPAADGSAERTTKFEKAPPMCIDPAKTYKATFDTNKGVVKVTLDAKGMPGT